jgi:2-haloacid dehalogenase
MSEAALAARPATWVVFDAYGTLFDVASATRRAAEGTDHAALADRAEALGRLWRDKQIGYSWWRAVTGRHADFWQVTMDALDHALEATGLEGEAGLRDALAALYRQLDAYPEVPQTLSRLRAAGRRTAILSNGAPDMLGAAIDSAGIADALDAVLSVEEVGVFKPDPRVYDLVGTRLGPAAGDVLFVSANGWDAAAAAAYGFRTAWVNRAGAASERLPGTPDHVVADLSAIPDLAAQP